MIFCNASTTNWPLIWYDEADTALIDGFRDDAAVTCSRTPAAVAALQPMQQREVLSMHNSSVSFIAKRTHPSSKESW
jgi:hypothetical protein